MPKLLVAAAVVLLAVAAAPALGATRTVRVDDDVFRPGTATVKRGDVLRFRWVGESLHNVVVTRGPRRFRSPLKRSGTYRKRMTRRGTYRIVCTVHSGMRLRVRVR